MSWVCLLCSYIMVEAHREAELSGFRPKISFNLDRVTSKKRKGRKVVHIRLQHVGGTAEKIVSTALIPDGHYVWFQSIALQGIAS